VTRILCFADLHLKYGSPYDREPGDRLEDQVKVGQRIVEIARERECSLILNAGDTYEGPIVQPEEYAAYARSIGEWHGEILAVLGNGRHDSAKRSVTAPEVIDKANTITTPCVAQAANCAIACLPWCPVDRLVATRGGGERADINREAAAHLISIAQDLRAECSEKFPDLPAILLAHWSVEGGVTATGVEAINFAEPIIPRADIEAMDWSASFFGHVHAAQELLTVMGGPIVIPGSPLPLSFGEPGEHGVWIFDTETGAAEFVPIESRPLVTVEIPLDQFPDDDPWTLLAEYGDDAPDITDAIVKVRYTATAEQAKRIDHRKLRDALYEAGAHKVFAIEPIVERETRARVEGVTETLGEMEALDAYIEAQVIDAKTAGAMRKRTSRYLSEVGA